MCCFGRKKDSESLESATRVANFSPSGTQANPRPRSSRPGTPTSPSSPTANSRADQPKDDASIIRLFSLIDNSITDHVLNYYISSNNGSDRFSNFGGDRRELQWVLQAAPSSLKEARTQVVVIRAIIGYEIFKAIQDDFFIPPAAKKALEKKRDPGPVDPKWRLNHFQSLTTSQRYHQHRERAIDMLANNILEMTQPLANSAGDTQESSRLKNLKAIAEKAAEFAITIGKQKPTFAIIFPHFGSGASGSVSRSNSRAVSRTRNPEEPDIPVVVPELRKYGDEQGRNYEKFLTLVPLQRLPELS